MCPVIVLASLYSLAAVAYAQPQLPVPPFFRELSVTQPCMTGDDVVVLANLLARFSAAVNASSTCYDDALSAQTGKFQQGKMGLWEMRTCLHSFVLRNWLSLTTFTVVSPRVALVLCQYQNAMFDHCFTMQRDHLSLQRVDGVRAGSSVWDGCCCEGPHLWLLVLAASTRPARHWLRGRRHRQRAVESVRR